MTGSLKTAVLAATVATLVASGATLAATQVFTLGTTNRVDAPTKVTNVRADGNTVNPVAAPLLTLENETAAASSTPLSLVAAQGHPALKVNTGAKVPNLNADSLDGIDSSGFLAKTAKAGDADRLDGLDSSAFTQGGGHVISGHVENVPVNGSGTLVTLPGSMTVTYFCLENHPNVSATMSKLRTVMEWNGAESFLGPNITGWSRGSTGALYIHLLASRPFVNVLQPPRVLDDVVITGGWDPSSSACTFQAVAHTFG